MNPATAEHLNQQEPDASGRRMNKRTLTLCHRRREVSETEGGEPLNRKGRRDFQREPLGNPKQGVRRSHSVFGISPRAFERPERDPGAEPRHLTAPPGSTMPAPVPGIHGVRAAGRARACVRRRVTPANCNRTDLPREKALRPRLKDAQIPSSVPRSRMNGGPPQRDRSDSTSPAKEHHE
jgi:hypothetical protein